MGKLLVIYDLMQHSVKIGSETERQSNCIVTRNRRDRDMIYHLLRAHCVPGTCRIWFRFMVPSSVCDVSHVSNAE